MDDLSTARKLLVDWYDLVSKAPRSLLGLYGTLDEISLVQRAEADFTGLLRGDHSLRLANGATAVEALHTTAAWLRALDAVAWCLLHDPGLPADPEGTWLVVGSDANWFLIPRVLPRKPPRAVEHANSNGPFTHRALVHHRILPARIGDLAVRLACVPMVMGRGSDPIVLGGPLFAELDLVLEDAGEGFRISAVGHDPASAIEDRLRDAVASSCAAIVFPELTVDGSGLERISTTLRRRRPIAGTPRSLPVVVAGSWHEPLALRFRNVARVFDGFGDQVVEHAKTVPMIYQGRAEAIEPGEAITVLVTDDALVGLAICLDFCDRGGVGPNPYALLDVDLMLVTSLGSSRAMEGHMATAHDIWLRWRAETFVVQQLFPPNPPLLGFVLAPGDDPRGEPSAISTEQAWNLRPRKPNP